jgi:alkyl hydroperoxide reductase subunit AhpF
VALISPSDQQRLRDLLAEMSRPVRLLFFTQTLDCETCLVTKQILDELPALSDRITVEEVNFVLEKDRAAQYGIDRAPAVAVVAQDAQGAEQDTRIRFVGAPAGYGFMPLVRAVRLAGGAPPELSDESRQRLAAVTAPTRIQVFTTPT